MSAASEDAKLSEEEKKAKLYAAALAYRSPQPPPSRPYPEKKLNEYKVGFIPGTGRMGSRLALNHAKLGNAILLGSRDIAKATSEADNIRKSLGATATATATITACSYLEVARDADVIYWSPAGSKAERDELLKSIAKELNGKIICDVSDIAYLPEFDDTKWGQTSSTEWNVEAMKPFSARWVCGYKCTAFNALNNPVHSDGKPQHTLIAGDDVNANHVIRDFAEASGFKALDGGNLKNIRIIELMGPMWVADVQNRNTPGPVWGGWRWVV